MKERVLLFLSWTSLLLASACPIKDDAPAKAAGPTRNEIHAFRQFVEAMPRGGEELSKVLTGEDSEAFIHMLGALQGIVQEAALTEAVRHRPNDLGGTIQLQFSDGGTLELRSRVSIQRRRIKATPQAFSNELTDWSRLRFEEVGASGTRGIIRSKNGAIIAEGPKDSRRVERAGLNPAVKLIDEAFEESLSFKVGRRLVAEDANGSRILSDSEPRNGSDITTSLDDELQVAAEEILGVAPGALVAVDPRTGGIRALAANPAAEKPEESPAATVYSPGSTFKVVTAIAALEARALEIDDKVTCPKSVSAGERQITNFESGEYGSINFTKAFAVSCNTAFAQIGMRIGAQRLLTTADKLGFETGVSSRASISVPKTRGELAVRAFGADGVVVSPIHMAEVGSTIAAGGVRRPAGWIDRPRAGVRAIRPATADDLIKLMEEVVRAGTGKKADIAEAKIAGKTGTADPSPEDLARGIKPNAWFVAVAPSESPRLVVVAFLIRGGVGGDSAAPMAGRFLSRTAAQWGN